jgi:SAM-dependent methyltransferase
VSENVHGQQVLSKDLFGIYECLTCKTTFTGITSTDDDFYKKYYKSDYYLSNEKYGLVIRWVINFLRKISYLRNLRLINKYKSPGNKILEIGCGNGSFLNSLPSHFEKHGIEINNDGYKFIKENYKNIRIYSTKIGEDDLGKDIKNFDIIVMWNVLEHIDNPMKFIQIISTTLLASHGVFIFDVPNRNSLGFRMTKENWFHLDTPRHLFHYQYDTVNSLLEMHGLKIIKVSGNPIDYFHDFSVSIYKKIITENRFLNFMYGVMLIPTLLLVRLFISLFVPNLSEINTYIVRHRTEGNIRGNASLKRS